MGYTKEYIKQRTQEIYDSLPTELEQRKRCFKERNEIIDLNYSFFGYVASTTFVENTPYEDKFQTAILSFMGMWWKYKWGKYRADLAFTSFFKLRIAEEVKRRLSTVSYTTRRTLCMKVAKQLNKKWSEVNYDDLSKVSLPVDDMIAIKAVLGASYPADLADHELFLEAPSAAPGIEKYHTCMYDTIEELLIQEMIETESRLTDKKLYDMANMYCIPYEELQRKLPLAMEMLYNRLKANLDE